MSRIHLPLLRIEFIASLLAAGLVLASPAAEQRTAPNFSAPPVNQLQISGNACGPAALIASFRCGDANWQHALTLLPAEGDKEQIGQWIRRYGLQPSASLKGRKRWTGAGINVDDLVVATNEMTRSLYLPQVMREDLFIDKKETPDKLLGRLRDHLDRSLSKGIPPLLSVKRYALRGGAWTTIQGHFITVTGVDKKTSNGSFEISYLDPWGGKRSAGLIRIPAASILAPGGSPSPCLESVLPSSNIGKSDLRKGETTAIVPTAVIGRW